jgi:type IV secretory pathway protease TraF
VIRGADLRTKAGLFKTHRIGDSLFYEIPRDELNRDMLFTTEIEKTPQGVGYGGQAISEHLIRWERRDNRILLRGISEGITASDTTNPVTIAVQNASYSPIIAAFPIAAFGPDSAPVINVTAMFKNPPAEISVTARYRGAIDPQRTFLSSVATYPTNIEVRSDLTINGATGAADPLAGRGSGLPTSATFLVHWSMLKLPDHPMQPRLFDERVGFFSNSVTDFAHASQKSETRTFITRYRLECSSQKVGNLCVPVKPITYYVDPATPKWLVPWVKKAIMDWTPAFEAAGFKDGIVAKEAPSKAEDPDWSAEDARYAVIDWLPSTTENAVGPHTADPRTGEIISAHLQIYHNVMNLNRDWYWTQVGAVDPRMTRLPLPDSLAGRLMEYVIAHEIGHSIGLQHDMKGSAMYPADSVRSASFVHRMGHTPSLMDYSRYNYVAQPEDHIALEDLIPRVGPYDTWAIGWGYRPIPTAASSDAERPTLDQWAREQDTKPWLRFATVDANGADPRDETEAVGDDDPVKSTGYGIKNIKRLVPMLAAATINPTEDNSDLKELYSRLFGQWSTELRHVANLIGGVETQEKYGSQPGARFTPMSKARQVAAVKFLNENAFQTPTFFLRPEILNRIEPSGTVAMINNAQTGVLNSMLQNARLSRLLEWEASAKAADAYTVPQLFADVRAGIWGELNAAAVKVDVYRRGLQHGYVTMLRSKIVVAPLPAGLPAGVIFINAPTPPDIRALARQEMKTLDGMLAAAQKKASDAITRAHLDDLRHEIDETLNPKN